MDRNHYGEKCSGPYPSTSGVRRRTPKVTASQLDALLAIIEARPFLCTKKFPGLEGRELYEASWREVAEDLNNHPNGSVKTPEQWKTVWRDLKSRACIKAAMLKKQKVQTGNREVTTAGLNETDKRIISIVGAEYTFGTQCPDPMPEEDILQREMETGMILPNDLEIPAQSRSSAFLCLGNDDSDEQASQAHETTASVSTSAERPGQLPENQSPATQITVGDSRAGTVGTPAEDRDSTAEAAVRARIHRNRNLNPRRTVAQQLNLARQEFLEIAQSNAESMRMMATANQTVAEAVKTLAEATQSIGQGLNKIADAIMIIANRNP